MQIREGEDFVDVIFRDAIPHDLPGADDILLRVTVASSGFRGLSDVWVEISVLRLFLQKAVEFERQRRGAIELGSMSPDLFRLRVFSVDRKGHLAVNGRIGVLKQGSQGRVYTSAVEFEFEFDPGQLVPFVNDLRRMLEGSSEAASM